MNNATIEAVLIWPEGRLEELASQPKAAFARALIERASTLFSARLV